MKANTPLWKVFEGYEAEEIPSAFAEQFLATPERDYDVVLEGQMHEIWHRPRWLKPLFIFLGWLGILVPREGKNVPTTLTVVPGYLSDGKPYHEWNRTLAFKPPVQFNTRVVFDVEKDNLADQVGPKRFIHMVWLGRYIPPRRFTLSTVTNALQAGGRRWYMPRWLWLLTLGRVSFIQEAHKDNENVVDVDLRILHPLFGEVFGYRGTFEAVRYPRQSKWE